MEASYLTNDDGERIGVVPSIEEYERLRKIEDEMEDWKLCEPPGKQRRLSNGARKRSSPGIRPCGKSGKVKVCCSDSSTLSPEVHCAPDGEWQAYGGGKSA